MAPVYLHTFTRARASNVARCWPPLIIVAGVLAISAISACMSSSDDGSEEVGDEEESEDPDGQSGRSESTGRESERSGRQARSGAMGRSGSSGRAGGRAGASAASARSGSSGASGRSDAGGSDASERSGSTGAAGRSGGIGSSGAAGRSGGIGSSGAAGRSGAVDTSGASGRSGRTGRTGSTGASGRSGSAAGSSSGGTTGVDAACPEGEPVLCGITAAHNEVRANLPLNGKAAVQSLTWSDEVARSAQAYAEQCRGAEHSPAPHRYGENIFLSAGNTPTGATVVSAWASEVEWFDLSSNRCSPPASPPGQSCGHYTQVIWRSTKRVGCGYQRCSINSPFSSHPTYDLVICQYDPPGNAVGRSPY